MKPTSCRADSDDLPIFIDGRLVGWISDGSRAKILEGHLRRQKLCSKSEMNKIIPPSLEIVHCPKPLNEDEAVMNPSIHLLTEPARMMRPLINVNFNKIELIGVMEQVWLYVAVNEKEAHELTDYQGNTPIQI